MCFILNDQITKIRQSQVEKTALETICLDLKKKKRGVFGRRVQDRQTDKMRRKAQDKEKSHEEKETLRDANFNVPEAVSSASTPILNHVPPLSPPRIFLFHFYTFLYFSFADFIFPDCNLFLFQFQILILSFKSYIFWFQTFDFQVFFSISDRISFFGRWCVPISEWYAAACTAVRFDMPRHGPAFICKYHANEYNLKPMMQ